MRDDRSEIPPPEGEVFIVGGDGSPEPVRSEPGGQRPAGVWRRVGVAVGIAAVFVFGVVVGRTGMGADGTGGSLAMSPATASSLPVATTLTTAGPPPRSTAAAAISPSSDPRRTGNGGSSATATAVVLNPAFTAAIALHIPGGPEIQSMVALDGNVVALAPGFLARVSYGSDGSLRDGGQTAVGLPIGDPGYADWELLSDGQQLWAVSLGGANRVYLVDPSTMQTVAEWNAHTVTVVDAVAMDGHLYLNTSVGVFDVSPSTRLIDRSGMVARGGQAMAADSTRHRLLVLNNDGGWEVRAYLPPESRAVATVSLPFDAQSIAVVDGAIWVTGRTYDVPSRPVLVRLDSSTLQVAGHSEIEKELPSAPTIAAHGTALWLRDAEGDGQLWCIDPHSGAVGEHWPALPGTLAAHTGHAFIADGGVIGELNSNTCTD